MRIQQQHYIPSQVHRTTTFHFHTHIHLLKYNKILKLQIWITTFHFHTHMYHVNYNKILKLQLWNSHGSDILSFYHFSAWYTIQTMTLEPVWSPTSFMEQICHFVVCQCPEGPLLGVRQGRILSIVKRGCLLQQDSNHACWQWSHKLILIGWILVDINIWVEQEKMRRSLPYALIWLWSVKYCTIQLMSLYTTNKGLVYDREHFTNHTMHIIKKICTSILMVAST